MKLGRTLVGMIASLFPSNLTGILQEFPINLLAVVLARGGEAKVGGEECENDGSTIAGSTMSFLKPGVCCDDIRICLPRELDC